MIRRLAATLGLLALVAAPAQAQIPLLDVRIGAHAALPQGDFGDAYDAGFGAYARVGVPLLMFKLMGSATFTQFKAANPLVEDTNEITLQVGPHFSPIPLLDLGLEAAYLTDAKEWAYSPNVSIGLLMLDVTASYNKTFESGGASWLTLGVGFRF
ncbi:MAG: hypothetical protein KF709_10605 [Gemmatimonadaceae bacterium]|nr:hypothetical protein [Gemmatimonadaceae bacterium]